MKKDLIADYLSCIALKVFGPVVRRIPPTWVIFLGRRIGDISYYVDCRHRAIVYANIKNALGAVYAHQDICRIIKRFYRHYGQNLMEVFFIPLVNKDYINKYISIEGKENIRKAFSAGKGVIFLGVHAGSWELSNVICANLGFPFVLFVRQQRFRCLNNLLNSYRKQRGCRIIERQNSARELIKALKENEAIGMTADQGGKAGEEVDFLGKGASMPTGAVRLALKYGSAILPSFYTRIRGPYQKVIIGEPFKVKDTADLGSDIKNNLRELVKVFEGYIKAHPYEYLWTYKIWKYSRQKRALILSDSKAGHIQQSETAASALRDCLSDKGMRLSAERVELRFKNKLTPHICLLAALILGKYSYRLAEKCLNYCLDEATYKALMKLPCDIVISCGSSLAGVNYLVSILNQAKKVALMRPSILGINKFDLVILPAHDRPAKRNNVFITAGALNLIDKQYLEEQAKSLIQNTGLKQTEDKLRLGLLLGGDTKDFRLKEEKVKIVIEQLKSLAKETSADILATTSRRTPAQIEGLVKKEFSCLSSCKFLVIANENNFSFTVGGILGLSKIAVVSPESISMVSEAASAGGYVIVFDESLGRKHRDFLNRLSNQKHIYLVKPEDVYSTAHRLLEERPLVNILKDREKLSSAFCRII